MNEFAQRLTGSIAFMALLFGAIFYSYEPYFKPFFILFGALIIGVALWEYYRIGQAKGYEPLAFTGIIGSTLYILSTQSSNPLLPYTILLLTLMVSFGYYFQKGYSPYANLGITLFGLAYLTIPLSCTIQINYLPDGRWWLLYLLLVTKFTDIGAYFVGKKWGRHKLTPYISPNKTWEGAVGGVVTGTLISLLVYSTVSSISLTFLEAIGLGIVLSVVAQFGDLAESLLKRDGGVKDSSKLPGLGGMLDVVDSLVFTSPLLYLYLLEMSR